MRYIVSLLIIATLCPVQAWASGLELFKPKTKKFTMVQSSPKVDLSEFRVTTGNGRYDWFITLTNTSDKNLARNTYSVRAMQIDHGGSTTPAGSPFTLNQDIRPGKSITLQQQFQHVTGIARMQIDVVDSQNNKLIGTGTFSASTANPGNIPTPAASNAAATAGSATGNSVGVTIRPEVLESADLKLVLTEVLNNKRERELTLTITNKGTTTVNMTRYDVVVQGHLMLRPIESKTIRFKETLKPGAAETQAIGSFDSWDCASFTQYTVTARDKGSALVFEERVDIAPPLATVKAVSLLVQYSDKHNGFQGNIGDNVILKMDVTNHSNRFLYKASLLGTLALSGCNYPYPFDIPVDIRLAAGQKKRVEFSFPLDQLSSFGTGFYRDGYELWGLKPSSARVSFRLGSASGCGIQAVFSNMDEIEWKK
nr:hypothetical protein [uncultured Pseudodesulfovibrio sp.]